ncbi:SPW repeat protein [Pontibacter sp. 172403-2]|uniref:SPW repeat protein n=1 Tax=Pontibacter rufus TaxID=2791028 RepID=UPI0018B004E3|nr:SPW repeat protein [Pontibacter sp. 172403-2]MBF9255357.1 SPW repeat protein [Pontibacter sp. 172403-2]
MRFIPTRFHGILDYIVGIIFVIAPWVFDFADSSAATWTMVIAGIIVLVQAVCTNYEPGIIKKIPMTSHLMMDFGLGVILALTPWMFNFADEVYVPHVVGGIFSILASLTTHRVPSTSYRTVHPQHDRVRP